MQIISVGIKKNPISKLFSKSKLLKVIEVDDLDGSYIFLDKLIKSWQSGKPLFNKIKNIDMFSRENLSKELDSILRSI